MTSQTQRITPAWDTKQTSRQQSTIESADVANALTAPTKQLTIIAENNLRMEKKFDETNVRLNHQEQVSESLIKSVKNILQSLKDVMEKVVYPLCDLRRIGPIGKYQSFTTILEELTADTTMEKKTSNGPPTTTSNSKTVTPSAVNDLNINGT
ncbi:unnamed protein product [Rotaria sordida]|uniref:Uncharacterized protein n=1 Tax=Rotaria sordida TaxID=392033 RepID=A0A815TJP9_9BILA|nr:unnamed protein product [Rotaria sordida]CAF4172788.1 unnamed protein product [Rotaria sordida]